MPDEVEELLKIKIPNWEVTSSYPDLIEYTHKDGKYFLKIKKLPDDTVFSWTVEVWNHPYEENNPYIEFYDTIDDEGWSLNTAIKIAHTWMLKHPSVEKKYARLVWEVPISAKPDKLDVELAIDTLVDWIQSTIRDDIEVDDIEICDHPYEVTGEKFVEDDDNGNN